MLGQPRARSIACTGASPRWGAVFPQSAHSLPPDSASSASGESSQEAVLSQSVNTAAPPPPQPSVADFARALELPSIRKVSGGAKVGFFHDFGDGDEEGELGVEGAGGRRSDSDGEQQHVLSSDESDGESGAVDALETSAGTCLSTDLSPPAPPLSSPRVAPATGTPNSAFGDDQPAGASLPPTSVRRGRLRWPTPCAMLLFVECRISCPLALRHPRLITSRCPSNRVLLGNPVRVRRRRLRPALAVSSRRRRTRGWARVWTWST